MNENQGNSLAQALPDERYDQGVDQLLLSRRTFVQALGAGLLISVHTQSARGQRSRGRGPREARVSARIHIARDGHITVLSGKVDMGQGARGEIGQAAAEELRVSLDQVEVLLGDTSLVPDDGITAGSRTTPSTIPAVRRGAALPCNDTQS